MLRCCVASNCQPSRISGIEPELEGRREAGERSHESAVEVLESHETVQELARARPIFVSVLLSRSEAP